MLSRYIANLKERFNIWLDDKVYYSVDRLMPGEGALANLLVQRLDRDALSERIAANEDMRLAVSLRLQMSALDGIDTDEIAEKAARGIDAADVAYHMSVDDVAANMDIDIGDVASRLADDLDMSSLAEELDYDKLAQALVCKLKEAWTN